MSKHLPRDKELGLLPSSLPPSSLEASHLLKQIYSRPGSYFPDLEAGVSSESSQFLNYARLAGSTGAIGYPASPAQPVPLKPNVYSPAMAGHSIEGYAGAFAASADQSHIYSHSSSSFHLYNRAGQSWYTGNWIGHCLRLHRGHDSLLHSVSFSKLETILVMILSATFLLF